MRRLLLPAFIFGLFSWTSGTLPAQEPLALIEKALKAHGGEERIAKLKARHNKVQGTVQIEGGIAFTQEVFYQWPGQIKEITHVEVNGRKQTVVHVLNGVRGWIEIDGQAQDINDKKLTEMKEAAHLARVSRLLGLKDPVYRLSALGESAVDGRSALGVKVEAKGHRDLNLYFDKESGLLVKTERKAPDLATDQSVNEETFYGGWKDIDGLKVPMTMTIQRNGKKFMEAEATEVKFMERIEDGVFGKP